MLQPLWESRDRYEELKQMDDALREVSRLCEELGSTGPPPHQATPPRGPPAELIRPTEMPGAMQRCSVLRGLTDGRRRALGESVPCSHGRPWGFEDITASATHMPSEQVSGPVQVPPLLPGPTLFKSKAMKEIPWKSHPHTQPRDSGGTLRSKRPTPALVGCWGWSCVSGRLELGWRLSEKPREPVCPGRTPEGVDLLQGPCHLGPRDLPRDVQSPKSGLPSLHPPSPSLSGAQCSGSHLPAAAGLSPLGLAWHPPPTPQGPLPCSLFFTLAAAVPPPCLPARNSHHALLSLRVALDPLNLLCVRCQMHHGAFGSMGDAGQQPIFQVGFSSQEVTKCQKPKCTWCREQI